MHAATKSGCWRRCCTQRVCTTMGAQHSAARCTCLGGLLAWAACEPEQRKETDAQKLAIQNAIMMKTMPLPACQQPGDECRASHLCPAVVDLGLQQDVVSPAGVGVARGHAVGVVLAPAQLGHTDPHMAAIAVGDARLHPARSVRSAPVPQCLIYVPLFIALRSCYLQGDALLLRSACCVRPAKLEHGHRVRTSSGITSDSSLAS